MHATNTARSVPFPSIDIAKTVSSVADLSNPYAAMIVDRSQVIDEEFVKKVVSQSVFSWEGRKPRLALDADFAPKVQDLDLLSFMVPLVARGAVIEIPEYRNRRKAVRKAGERRIGTSRFGKTTGLTSNKDVFSFSVRIFDQSVVVRDAVTEAETMGAHRNFMLVDCDGHWYDGWNQIVWDPSHAENAFLAEHGLWSDNAIYFTHYVHPNRRQSIFGAPYLLLKMLSARLTDEAAFYRMEMKRLEEAGFVLPEGEKMPYVKPAFEGTSEKIKVSTMEVELDTPKYTGWYAPVPRSVEGLVEAYRRQKLLTYTLKPLVQFVVRADEAAYYKYGLVERYVAPWIKGVSWEDGFKLPKGRVTWSRLEFSPSLALRYRVKEMTQEVSAQ